MSNYRASSLQLARSARLVLAYQVPRYARSGRSWGVPPQRKGVTREHRACLMRTLKLHGLPSICVLHYAVQGNLTHGQRRPHEKAGLGPMRLLRVSDHLRAPAPGSPGLAAPADRAGAEKANPATGGKHDG